MLRLLADRFASAADVSGAADLSSPADLSGTVADV
jgi:hypothetical protein